MSGEIVSVKPSWEGDPISVVLGEGGEAVDSALELLFVKMGFDQEAWLAVTKPKLWGRPRCVEAVLAAVDEFRAAGNERLALLMLAHGFSVAAMAGPEKKMVNQTILKAMQGGEIVTSGMQEAMPNVIRVYSQIIIAAR